MKILHYVDENRLVWARPWLQLIKYLERSGAQNHILCRPGGTLGNYVRENNIFLSTYKPPVSSLPFLCLGLSSIFKAIKPDLLHTRLSSAALIGGYWGRRTGVPVVSTIDKYPKRKYYRNSDRLIPCSTAVAAHMKKQGFSESDMELIYNPVDIEVYQRDLQQREKFRQQHNIAKDDFIILGAGRFVDWKGFEVLIKACAAMHVSEAIKKNWHVWLVGDGPEMLNYQKCVSDCALHDKISFWGFQSDMRQFLWAADLFVQPSREPEGFSLMLLEAMAAGLPAIATAIGGTLDIIDDEKCGWLFSPDDIQELASILRRLILSDNIKGYSEAAQKRAADFSIDRIGEQTLRFYKNVIGSL